MMKNIGINIIWLKNNIRPKRVDSITGNEMDMLRKDKPQNAPKLSILIKTVHLLMLGT